MAASNTDKITDTRNAARPNSARVTSGRAAAGATLACDNLSGWPTASKVHFVTYKVDSNSAVVAGTQLDCYGIVSGNNIGSFTVVDGNDTGHAVGDYVEMLPTAAWGQDLADALTSTHNRSGGLKTGITLTQPTIADYTNAVHTHASSAQGGQLTGSAALVNSTVTANKLNTGAATATVATNEGSTSTSYVQLATTTDTVTVTIGVNGIALVTLSAVATQATLACTTYMSFDVSGATTTAANDNKSLMFTAYTNNVGENYSGAFLVTGLTAGSTTFGLRYRVAGGSANGAWANRRIGVIPL